jgi:hypothetical protein
MLSTVFGRLNGTAGLLAEIDISGRVVAGSSVAAAKGDLKARAAASIKAALWRAP